MMPLRNPPGGRQVFMVRMLVLLIAVMLLAYTEALERFDFIVYDKLCLLQQHQIRNGDVVIIAIDDESLTTLGPWPWSRAVHAELIDRLASIDNTAIALDLLFMEAHDGDPEADALLASAIAAHGRVILPVTAVSDSQSATLRLAQPLPMFAQFAALAHTDIELDSDGLVRRVFLFAGLEEPSWPTLGLALTDVTAARKLRHDWEVRQASVTQPSHWVRAQQRLIPYVGQPGTIPSIAYARVLFDDQALASLSGKTLIVGMTAAGMGMRFATPASPSNRQPMTGAEWHANVYSMMTHQRAIQHVSPGMTAIVSITWILILIALMARLRKDLTVPLLLGGLVLTLLGCALLLLLANLWLPPGAALLGIVSLYPLWNWRRINRFLHAMWMSTLHSSTALESIDDGVIITDAGDHVIYMNKGAEKILCTELDRIKGRLWREILDFYTQPKTLAMAPVDSFLPSVHTMVPEMIECSLKTIHGDERTVRITRNQLMDDHAGVMGAVIAMTDITDRIELSRQVAHQQSYDALTKLPNRTRLLMQFDNMIKVTGSAQTIVVLLITLDNFKKINDAMGHHAGDKLLRMVSDRLFDIVEAGDIVARWGGDEFVLLSGRLNQESMVTDTAQKILDSMQQRFEIDGLDIFVSVSIGISQYPDNGMTSETVLARAGTAMYGVKQDGGNQYAFYSPESTVVWTRDQLELERELRVAIKNDELLVLFQPIVDAKTQQIVRMEALVRWLHPKRGFLSPSEFIPLAEDIGQIEQLGEIVLRNSCIVAHRLMQLGYPVKVSVNVNPRQLLNRNFSQTVFQILRETGLPAKSLILEITESAIVNDMARVSKVLEEIRQLDILIALDDFGTGYSSLTLLRELPIDILKIDKSFVRTLDQNLNDLKIVQAIIGLGKNLGLTIIAEGVETEQQSALLLQHECYFHQGYYFSKPISYDSLYEMMNTSVH